MDERRLQFRVGLLAIVAIGIAGWLVFRFGELRELWQPTYQVEVLFDRAPGMFTGTPVRINGMKVGSVKEVRLAESGVIAVLKLDQSYLLYEDAEVGLSRGLLGDASVNVLPGHSQTAVKPGFLLHAAPYVDPMEAVSRMETNVASTLQSFQATSDEWRKVGVQMSSLLETNRGNLDIVVERTAESLHEFTVAMQAFTTSANQANAILGDPKNQENLRRTLETVPVLVEDTRAVIVAVRTSVQAADESLANLAEATGPLADRSASITNRLDGTLANLEALSLELKEFAQLANSDNSTFHALATNPSLYRNLDRSAESLSLLLTNLEPVLRDMRIFSDRIARHPELMGLGGALAPSDGTKEVQPASHEMPAEPGAARIGTTRRIAPN
jgi:phospholipid/cholesterol/gamma-HCH transport system substrate-binding protein